MSPEPRSVPDFQDAEAPVLFLHANGFPSGAYTRFLDRLRGVRRVLAPQVIETPQALRASHRWPRMTEQVQALIAEAATAHGAVVLVGHSMGGYLSLLAGARQSTSVAAVVLIDSPLVVGWRGTVFGMLRVAGLTRHGGPAPIAARRRFRWPSSDQAVEHFRSKDFARRWAPGVLEDFIAHGLSPDPDGTVSLRIAREAERDIYAHLPAGRALRSWRHLRERGVPVHMIAGRRSVEMGMAGREANQRLFGDRWHEIDTGHLVPMERPQEAADLVLDCLAQR